jgi:hypothetical protein
MIHWDAVDIIEANEGVEFFVTSLVDEGQYKSHDFIHFWGRVNCIFQRSYWPR